ncbi:hypothetical protein Bca4012_072478 [Brassica carinata]|uniref:Uncharacterized protein n=1 Tax=Brassica carinata TaxID=52824 RepID=A0A8X7QHM4_BRACI|nr:hypothetical protein Bca52824_064862 [Brassica carinata]
MASLVGAPPPPSDPPDPDLDVVLLVDPRDPPVPPDPPPPLPLSNLPSFHLFAHSELLPHIDLVCSPFISARAASVVRDHHWSVSSSSSPDLLTSSLAVKAFNVQHFFFLCNLSPLIDGQLSTTGSCSVLSKPPFDAAPGTCAFMVSVIELDDKLTWLVSGKLQIHHGNVGFQSICLSSTIAYSLTLVKVTRQGVSSYNDTSSSANDTPLQSCCRKHKSEQYLVEALLQKLPQPGFTSENSDIHYFTPRFSEFDNWQCGFNFVKTSWHHHEAITFRLTLCKALTLEFSTLKVLSNSLMLIRAIFGNL